MLVDIEIYTIFYQSVAIVKAVREKLERCEKINERGERELSYTLFIRNFLNLLNFEPSNFLAALGVISKFC